MRAIGQRRVTSAFVHLGQVAEALDTTPSGAARKLKSRGLVPQTLVDGKRKARVYRREAVAIRYPEIDLADISDRFVGATDAGEILGVATPNVSSTLQRHGVYAQHLDVGARAMSVYSRAEVERAQKGLRPRKKAAA